MGWGGVRCDGPDSRGPLLSTPHSVTSGPARTPARPVQGVAAYGPPTWGLTGMSGSGFICYGNRATRPRSRQLQGRQREGPGW